MCMETLLGTLRTLYLAPLIGDLPARQVGAVVSSFLILVVVYLCIHSLRKAT